jgi:hypothetical protein
MTDLVQHISEIARLFWGPENRALSSRTELRWGCRHPRLDILPAALNDAPGPDDRCLAR